MPIVKIAVGLMLACAWAQGASWEPFVAKVRRTMRIVDQSGTIVRETVSEHTIMRSVVGSLRREVRAIKDGQVVAAPEFVELSDTISQKTYTLNANSKVAVMSPKFSDPESQYVASTKPALTPVQSYLGIPCASMTSVFQENGAVVSKGKSCRAVGYGIVIFERSTIPSPNTKSTMYWETDLIEFQKSVEPPAELMQVPPGYKVVMGTLPAVPCKNCGTSQN